MSSLETVGGRQGERVPGDRAPAPEHEKNEGHEEREEHEAPDGREGAQGPAALLAGIPRQRVGGADAATADPATRPRAPWAARAARTSWRLLPTPAGTPFTFGYAVLLAGTSYVAAHADPGLVSALLQGSSTDVVHLAQAPVLVLVASALWIAGGVTSGYALGLLFVVTALERRVGGLRTAAVFLGGHALATLATEVPVAFAVAAGRLPETSLHRLDYGISFGVMTCTGALAGVLPAWSRWPLLAGAGYLALTDLMAYVDPMTDWGHLLSLALGVACWPLLRRWRAHRTAPAPLLGDLGRPALTGAP
ncbi:rhomboid-like protein [Streptomyces sp. NPDC020742]|uniref:rhomboid-like protein n=1 Tax=Streptomyces sp. NPDC020742 TaxID=3154897 RepID=UPI0033FCF865